MTDTWTIVAIPNDRDPVWKVSSEAIPHMTLLFLGEQDSAIRAAHILSYLQHAVSTSMSDFGMMVRKRGVLGEDQADVLFFDEKYTSTMVHDFRSHLLKNDTIKQCYEEAAQFPSWIPHLTLGYPESPAKEVEGGLNADEISYVSFDRVALWLSQDEGPEFDLTDDSHLDVPPEIPESEIAMSDITRAFLSQSGVIDPADAFLGAYGLRPDTL